MVFIFFVNIFNEKNNSINIFNHIFFDFANANIVEELTSLNNLYKEGAITKEEFTSAKSILLQTKDKKENKKKIEIVKKKKIEKKEKDKDKTTEITNDKNNEDLTKTYISV